MKYLKAYKLFESIDIDDLKDICLELEDDGFYIKFPVIRNNVDNIVDLRILRKSNKGGYYPMAASADDEFIADDDGFIVRYIDIYEDFRYNDVSETVERIKDYLGDNLIEITILNVSSTNEWVWTNQIDEDFYGKDVRVISIKYHK